ncbi:glutathione peroxidase-like [Saccoglossus kowalevskii]|uniref:glutathione peroxidase n=1 Tax=Saccoglossus kowalevskii TaxID=10224 RepID=A0ABM0MZ21_SACKO|nr:PREDICTED: epididymal secretory glutathione peroxidase-like [Saccoglossus kowalevskii]
MLFRLGAFVLLTLVAVTHGTKKYCEIVDPAKTFHSYGAVSLHTGEPVTFDQYIGWTLLVIPVATYDDLNHQYLEFNQLQTEFLSQNFTILAYPTTEFWKKEPGSNDEILNGLREVRPGGGYVPNFEIFEKVNVNGATQTDAWAYIKGNCHSPVDELGDSKYLFWEPFNNRDVRWTFLERIIIGADGLPYIRYNDPSDPYTPGGLRDDIEQYLRDGYIDL